MTELHPGLILLAGAILVPFLRGSAKSAAFVGAPALALLQLFQLSEHSSPVIDIHGMQLVLMKVDNTSQLFACIFILITLLNAIYMLHKQRSLEYSSGLLYAACTTGVVLAGDFATMFVCWEMLTLCAATLILAAGMPNARAVALRYSLVHVVGGVILMAGILMVTRDQGWAVTTVGLGSTGGLLMLIGIGVNCAFPLLHSWLPDAYSAGSPGGSVFLSAFTTKAAVYVLLRTFPGTEALIWIGCTMAIFPVLFAVIEDDLRKVLGYSLINQVGYMVVGIGIGSTWSLNGTACHAFSHILYKSLLFMSMGAVLQQTGRTRCTELGGLARSMPWTCFFCIIGAVSISAFPFTNGFISKSMILSAAGGHEAGVAAHPIAWLILLLASAAVLKHAGIKVPFFAFFSHDSGLKCAEAPRSMRIAMAAVAFLCIFLGCFPGVIYQHLPDPVAAAGYHPYTVAHVLSQSQLLVFSALGFFMLLLAGIYPAEIRCTNLDGDWFYRRGGAKAFAFFDRSLNAINSAAQTVIVGRWLAFLCKLVGYGPWSVAIFAAAAWYSIIGTPADERAEKLDVMRRIGRSHSIPIGFTAALAVLLVFAWWWV
ncbi:MAG: multicomponent Na+:H+ antiporter subunit D [Rhodothermales bacterium]|jgi:multicomponent Na+:H+ antiporter subunit D